MMTSKRSQPFDWSPCLGTSGFVWPLGGRMMLVPPSHPRRGDAEACIRGVYGVTFGARPSGFPHTLVAVADDAGRLVGAAGLRTAGEGFFSEIYLDRPVEDVLLDLTGNPVPRDSVFEVTTLASRNAAVSPGFLRQIAVLGKRAGFAWSFFTATARLRRLLGQLGVPVLELAEADPARIADVERWGCYYHQGPKVCAVDDQWMQAGARHGLRASA